MANGVRQVDGVTVRFSLGVRYVEVDKFQPISHDTMSDAHGSQNVCLWIRFCVNKQLTKPAAAPKCNICNRKDGNVEGISVIKVSVQGPEVFYSNWVSSGFPGGLQGWPHPNRGVSDCHRLVQCCTFRVHIRMGPPFQGVSLMTCQRCNLSTQVLIVLWHTKPAVQVETKKESRVSEAGIHSDSGTLKSSQNFMK